MSLTLQYAIPVCMQTAIISQLWILGHTLALFVAILMTWIWTHFLRFICAWAAGPRIVSATSRHAAGYFCADDWVDVVFRGTFRIWTWIDIWRHNIYKLSQTLFEDWLLHFPLQDRCLTGSGGTQENRTQIFGGLTDSCNQQVCEGLHLKEWGGWY